MSLENGRLSRIPPRAPRSSANHLTLPRISRLGSGTFPERARDASQLEVLLDRGSSVPSRFHVIHVKRRFLPSPGDTAVLAVIARSQPDPALERQRDMLQAHRVGTEGP